jgi:hypothetical protein
MVGNVVVELGFIGWAYIAYFESFREYVEYNHPPPYQHKTVKLKSKEPHSSPDILGGIAFKFCCHRFKRGGTDHLSSLALLSIPIFPNNLFLSLTQKKKKRLNKPLDN